MEHSANEIVVRLVYQLAIILIAAKLSGEVCVRFLKVPPVLGELGAGIIVGPFALGGLAFGGFGPLFPFPEAGVAGSTAMYASPELYSFAQVAAVVLLFAAGLETNLKQFLKYAGPAVVVAAGGLLLPFFLGVWITVFLGFAEGFGDRTALFVGALLTATSVSITVRVLNDMGRLDSPEAVTIIAAAVVDDVLGILVLAVVVGMGGSGDVTLGQIGIIGAKALAFWVALTAVGILLAERISRLVGSFRVSGAGIALCLALAFLAAALTESAGLAMIIGAYSIGLAFSNTSLARQLEEQIAGVYNVLVPVFFVVMGMSVEISAMGQSLGFALAVTMMAILGKVVGSGLPALAMGFNVLGASRVGIGMMPRGEVAIIIAGIGLTHGLIDTELFGVAIMMTVLTASTASVLLPPLFRRGGSGLRREEVGRREDPPLVPPGGTS